MQTLCFAELEFAVIGVKMVTQSSSDALTAISRKKKKLGLLNQEPNSGIIQQFSLVVI